MDLARFDVHHLEAELLHGLSYQPLLDLHQAWIDWVVYFLEPSVSDPVGLVVYTFSWLTCKNQVSEFFEASVNGTAEPEGVYSDSLVGVRSEHTAELHIFARIFWEEHDLVLDVDCPLAQDDIAVSLVISVRFFIILKESLNGLAIYIFEWLEVFFICDNWIDVPVPGNVAAAELLEDFQV